MEVKLTYFKESGKFYSSVTYKSSLEYPFEVKNEVKGFKSAGKLPGLRDGAVDFIILVDFPTLSEFQGCSMLIL